METEILDIPVKILHSREHESALNGDLEGTVPTVSNESISVNAICTELVVIKYHTRSIARALRALYM